MLSIIVKYYKVWEVWAKTILPEPQSDDIGPDVGAEDDGQTIEDDEEGKEAEDKEPEPDEYVDLLIHYKDNTVVLSLMEILSINHNVISNKLYPSILGTDNCGYNERSWNWEMERKSVFFFSDWK